LDNLLFTFLKRIVDPSDNEVLSELLFWAEEKRERQTKLDRKYLVMIVGFGSREYQIYLNYSPGYQINSDQGL